MVFLAANRVGLSALHRSRTSGFRELSAMTNNRCRSDQEKEQTAGLRNQDDIIEAARLRPINPVGTNIEGIQ